MQFMLTGFTQDMAFRVFAFERMGQTAFGRKFVVRADLALIRRYGIQMQELPLLCRNLLERSETTSERDSLLDVHRRRYEPAREGCVRPPRAPRLNGKSPCAGRRARTSELPGEGTIRFKARPRHRRARPPLSRGRHRLARAPRRILN